MRFWVTLTWAWFLGLKGVKPVLYRGVISGRDALPCGAEVGISAFSVEATALAGSVAPAVGVPCTISTC
jgi:hypothetical protein